MVVLYVMVFTLHVKYIVKKMNIADKAAVSRGCAVPRMPVFTHTYFHTSHLFCLGFYIDIFLCVILQFSQYVLRNFLLRNRSRAPPPQPHRFQLHHIALHTYLKH